MRNLKKLLAVVVTIAMIATFAIPAFAADAAKTDAQIVTDLGMLKGAGAGVTADYLATQPDRTQAAILFLRLLGKEAEAKAFTGTDNFSDVAGLSAENTAILAYLKAHPELGYGGVGGDKFDPLAKMTAKAYYKVVLVALGYAYGTDFTWENVMSFAASKGLTKNIDVETFTVNDLAVATVEGLKAETKAGGSLISKLVAAGTVASADAVASGIYTVPVVTPAIVSVSAGNLVEVVVTFNKAMDSDTIDDGDFIVDGNDVLADNVSLSDDKKVATLTVDAMSNGDEITVSASGIDDVNGVAMADFEGNVTPVDNEQPTVTGIEFTGPQTAKLSFSEPLNAENSVPDISIDGGAYSATPDENFANGDKDVTVDIGTELDEGSHVFKIKGFEDFAGYSNLVKNITKDYASITTAATASVKEADQSTVTLTFNRPVKGFDSAEDTGTLANFYQSYSNWHPLEFQDSDGHAIVDAEKYYDEVKLVFTNAAKEAPSDAAGADDNDKPLPVGNDKIVIKDGDVTDRWDNSNDGDVVLHADVAADNTKPEVTKVTVESETEIKVYFSKDMKVSDATDESNYVIKNSDGDIIKSTKWNIDEYNTDDNYTDIVFNDALDLGKYTITAEGIADTTISENTLDKVTKSFEIADKTASLDAATVSYVEDGRILYVKYDDAMATTGSGSVISKDNYRVDAYNPTSGVHSVNAKLDDSVKLSMFTSKIVKMVFPASQQPEVTLNLTIGKVADAAGNVVSDLAVQKEIEAEVAPAVTEIKRIAENKYTIKVDQELKSIAAGAIEVYDGAWVDANGDPLAKKAASAKFTNDGSDTLITITVPDTTGDVATVVPADGYTISIVGTIKSITGVPMDEYNYINSAAADDITIVGSDATLAYADGVAPAVKKDGLDDKMIYAADNAPEVGYIDQIIITYTEDINADTVSKYTYTVDGYDVSSVAVAGAVVTINIDELDPDTNDTDINDTPAVTQVLKIEDLAGNELAPQAAVDAISAVDAADPDRE